MYGAVQQLVRPYESNISGDQVGKATMEDTNTFTVLLYSTNEQKSQE